MPVLYAWSVIAIVAMVAGCDGSTSAADDEPDASTGMDTDMAMAELGAPIELEWPGDNPDYACADVDCVLTNIKSGPIRVEPFPDQPAIIDYPTDLREGERVTLILNLHGGGSYANWQRHYFPAKDHVDEMRLIVIHPQARNIDGLNRWPMDGSDDRYIRALIAFVDDRFEAVDIDAFWVVGHSNGGMYGNQISCFGDLRPRMTGHLNLSGFSRGAFGFGARCDINFIFSRGEHETNMIPPQPNPTAESYDCGAAVPSDDIVDAQGGQIYDTSPGRTMTDSWGGPAGPGSATFEQHPGCDNGRVVAGYVRLGKGHTEGHEPNVTRHMLELMLSASNP